MDYSVINFEISFINMEDIVIIFAHLIFGGMAHILIYQETLPI